MFACHRWPAHTMVASDAVWGRLVAPQLSSLAMECAQLNYSDEQHLISLLSNLFSLDIDTCKNDG
jgi:hypothetical protein